MSDEESFQLALDADPSNSFLRLVFADWLEEHGDERAMGMRAMSGRAPSLIWMDGADCWLIGTRENIHARQYDGCKLATTWFQAIQGSIIHRRSWKYFPSRRAAEDAAALAFARLTPEQQSAILASVKVPA